MGFQDFGDDGLLGALLEAGHAFEDDAVRQGRFRQGFEFVRGDVLPAADSSEGLRAAVKADSSAGAGAQLNIGMDAGCSGEADKIAAQHGVDVHPAHCLLDAYHFIRRGYGLQGRQGVGILKALEHLRFVILGRVAQLQTEQKAVNLGFRERESALQLNGVLRSQYQERLGQRNGVLVNGNLAFRHCFQQGGLGAGRSAVDFVGQDNLRNDGAGAEFKIGGMLVVVMDAGNVGWHQVGGELDAAEIAVQGIGKGTGEGSLADAGDILNQDVAAAEQGGQSMLNYGVLADDGLLDVGADGGGSVGDGAGLRHGNHGGVRWPAAGRPAR